MRISSIVTIGVSLFFSGPVFSQEISKLPGLMSAGHPVGEPVSGIMSSGHPFDGILSGFTSIGHAVIDDDIDVALIGISSREVKVQPFNQPSITLEDGYFFGSFDPLLVNKCKTSQNSRDDFFTLEQVGLERGQFHYSYDENAVNALLSDDQAKVVMYHGEFDIGQKNLVGYKFMELLQPFVAASSKIENVTLNTDGIITGLDGNAAKLVLPSIPSRLKTIDQSFQVANMKVEPGQISALALHYDCMAEFLVSDQNSIAFGVRGATIQDYNLKPVRIMSSHAEDNKEAHEVKIENPMMLLTSKAYGEEGEKLFAIVENLIRNRMRQDQATMELLNKQN